MIIYSELIFEFDKLFFSILVIYLFLLRNLFPDPKGSEESPP